MCSRLALGITNDFQRTLGFTMPERQPVFLVITENSQCQPL
jgi:hypothetical protein